MTRQELQDYADATAAALGVPIPPEYREGVINNLETIFAQSARLMSLTLGPLDEAAPVFRADDASTRG
jgi:hypothetical protein